LASWTSKALSRALTVSNVQAGFRRTGIYPLNSTAMDSSLGPSSAYTKVHSEGEALESPQEEPVEADPGSIGIEEVLLEAPPLPCPELQYMVQLAESEGEDEHQFPPSQQSVPVVEDGIGAGVHEGILHLLTLPTLPVPRSRHSSSEPIIDYPKSILLTSDAYLAQMEHMSMKRTDAAKAKDACKIASEERKRKREDDKILQLQKKKEREEEKAERAREKAYWVEIADRGWGNELHARMKSSLPPPPGSYRGVYVGSVPAWYITNQRRRRMLLDMRRAGASSGGGRRQAVHESSFLHGPGAGQERA
jgi:hypothetical protein